MPQLSHVLEKSLQGMAYAVFLSALTPPFPPPMIRHRHLCENLKPSMNRIHQVVIDALKECTEDYMFRRRSMGLVSDMIEDEIRGWSSSIATHVYFSYTVRIWIFSYGGRGGVTGCCSLSHMSTVLESGARGRGGVVVWNNHHELIVSFTWFCIAYINIFVNPRSNLMVPGRDKFFHCGHIWYSLLNLRT